MIGSYGESRPAAGFAFSLEQAMAAAAAAERSVDDEAARPLRIAVPKGSLNADTVAALEAAGLDTTGLDDPGRQLIIRNPGVEYVIVRPTDAPAFVSLGAADCGICGKDSLLEAQPTSSSWSTSDTAHAASWWPSPPVRPRPQASTTAAWDRCASPRSTPTSRAPTTRRRARRWKS